MKHFLCYLLFLFLLHTTSYAQEPTLTWGPAINKEPRLLQHMHVVGTTTNQSFYAVYLEEGQATLERYNAHNQRMWATALLPKTPANQPATFYDVVLLHQKLYLLSTFRAKGTTTVFAQEIAPNGNYESNVQAVISTQGNGRLHIAVSDDKSLLLTALAEPDHNTITAKLLNAGLQPRWSQLVTGQSNIQQSLLQNNGTAYLLTIAPAAAQNTFLLHRLAPQDGKPDQLPLAQEQIRPVQAKMASTTAQGLVVTGYYAPASEPAAQAPEPKGTFFYHFDTNPKHKPILAYTPFSPAFLSEYKRYKPETEKFQRLRNLQLRQVLPLASGGVILTGEVAYLDHQGGSRIFHNDDIVVVRLNNDGTPAYTTSANKLQNASHDSNMLSSYLATATGDTLHLLYLDFEYNYTAENSIIMAGPGAVNKEPVLITIPPAGRPQQVTPLHQSQTGRAAGFYLRPASGYRISNKEFIVLGVGREYYRYGRLKLE
ncbi:hypothetical protein [Botryobacter ruber]|uniref:hypothetical protein n=1 Tax=Botryobacter ruber TaxID=2171629 RepID=UPI000F645871|nr:hypothetical protein [Botryobacter ruber]